jgi:hypothetical protein
VGASTKAKDRAMQASLRSALVAAKTVYTDKSDYTLATAVALKAEETSIRFVDASTGPSGPNEVSVDPVSATYVVLSGMSKSGTCFYVADNASPTGAATLYAKLPSAGGCAASGAPAVGSVAWQSTW